MLIFRVNAFPLKFFRREKQNGEGDMCLRTEKAKKKKNCKIIPPDCVFVRTRAVLTVTRSIIKALARVFVGGSVVDPRALFLKTPRRAPNSDRKLPATSAPPPSVRAVTVRVQVIIIITIVIINVSKTRSRRRNLAVILPGLNAAPHVPEGTVYVIIYIIRVYNIFYIYNIYWEKKKKKKNTCNPRK